MRFRIPQFTLRRLIIAVAIVAVVLWLARLQQRHNHFIAISHMHDSRSRVFIAHGNWSSTLAEQMAYEDQVKEYHGEMARKYYRAAMRPWLPVEPDPPQPEMPEFLIPPTLKAYLRHMSAPDGESGLTSRIHGPKAPSKVVKIHAERIE